jgi:hypothetical protein
MAIIKWVIHTMDSSGSGKAQVVGCCEYSNELLGYIKCGKFLDELSS